MRNGVIVFHLFQFVIFISDCPGHQEQARREGGASGNLNSSQRKKRTLEELFRPPIELMHKGSFNTVIILM